MPNLIAVYGRLSKDEKGERYSSLEVQRDYVVQYIKDQALGEVVGCFLDDDVTGVLFQRAELDKLLTAVELGQVNVIVVKDLSRLGRSNAKTLTLLETFEELQVRVIAIDDQWDSFRNDDDIIGIKTWYNERYVKDISKKIRSNIHQKLKTGEYLGTAPYGYRKEYQTINGKLKPLNRLLVDETLRPVISEIFALYLEGLGYQSIAEILQNKGYPNPSQQKNYSRPISACWTKEHIKRIICNRVYCGDTVQGISERISYKSKKTRRKPSTAWYLTENTHEPLVSREIWLQANTLRQQKNGHRERIVSMGRHLFSGLLVCGACGRKLVARQQNHRPLGYVCGAYAAFGTQAKGCASHFVREDQLIKLLWRDFYNTLEEQVLLEAFQVYLKQPTAQDNYSVRLTALESAIRQCTNNIELLYEDRLNKVLSVEFFIEKSAQLEAKLTTLRAEVTSLKNQIEQQRSTEPPVSIAGNILVRLAEVEPARGLTRQILTRMVERIYVFLPGDIPSNGCAQAAERLQADWVTIQRLQTEGGLFIVYRYF